MKYLLFRQGEEGSEPATMDDFDSEFKATEWARSWLQTHAQSDRYVLMREGDTRSILMLRTVAGQWYAIPLTEEDLAHGT